MINTERFKKILHILKTNADDLNINLCIIDYDTSKECDYEVITLHLKETNTQNGAVVYKDFIIRSQLYYDPSEDKYLSALDGDIIVENGALSHIDILTSITDLRFSDDYINIKAKLIDSETNEPIKNQALFLYLSSSSQYIVSATTNKEGIASFTFNLKNTSVAAGDNLLYVKYNGNKIYRKATSSMILVNVIDEFGESLQNLESNIKANFVVDEKDMIHLRYNIAFGHKTLTDGFFDIFDINSTTNPPSEEDLLSGSVYFYINDLLLGQSSLSNGENTSYSEITVPFPTNLFGQDILIQAIFEGNNFFPLNIANLTTHTARVTATDISLTIAKVNNNQYNISFSFNIPDTFEESDISSDIQDSILLYLQNSSASLYLYDKYGQIVNHPFYHIPSSSSDLFNVVHNNSQYMISISPQLVSLNREDYGLDEDSPFRVKLVYDGNSLVEGFEIENGYYFDFDVLVYQGNDEHIIQDITVQLCLIDDEDDTQVSVIQEAITNEEGVCSFYNIPFGSYTLLISDETYIAEPKTVNVNKYMSRQFIEVHRGE